MGDTTGIEWTCGDDGTPGATWNPLIGCTRVSAGCTRCYAERQAFRCAAMGISRYEGLTRKVGTEIRWTGEVRLVEEALDLPLRWRRPRRIFVNSMSDLWHERVPDEWIDRIFAVMARCPQHTFQVLTKRPERMARWSSEPGGVQAFIPDSEERDVLKVWPLPNVWLGVSVEDQATADERIPLLLRTPAAVRWISYEPALTGVDFEPALFPVCRGCGEPKVGFPFDDVGLKWSCRRPGCVGEPWADGVRLDWLVIGGESGPGARPFDLAWARSVITQCRAAGVSAFVKQLGAVPIYHGQLLPRPEWMPSDTRIGIHDYGDGRVAGLLRLRDRKGGDWSEWPEDLRVREFPA